jgi:hypothetical protein
VSTLVVTPSLFDRLDGEPTLNDRLLGAWEGLLAHRAVQCPVCHGEMEPEYHGGGRCADCGSTLS